MQVYHAEYPNNTDGIDYVGAMDYARGLCWNEIESSKQDIGHVERIENVNGVGVWYCYGTDSFVFTDEVESAD